MFTNYIFLLITFFGDNFVNLFLSSCNLTLLARHKRIILFSQNMKFPSCYSWERYIKVYHDVIGLQTSLIQSRQVIYVQCAAFSYLKQEHLILAENALPFFIVDTFHMNLRQFSASQMGFLISFASSVYCVTKIRIQISNCQYNAKKSCKYLYYQLTHRHRLGNEK